MSPKHYGAGSFDAHDKGGGGYCLKGTPSKDTPSPRMSPKHHRAGSFEVCDKGVLLKGDTKKRHTSSHDKP